MLKEFERKLDELGLSFRLYDKNSYLLCHNNDTSRTAKIKLICSSQVDESEKYFRNENIIQSIGIFKFKLSMADRLTNFFVLALSGITYQRTDFVIIPTEELLRRLIKKSCKSNAKHRISLVLWLIDDRSLYETTHLGIEGEWYFLSRGQNGRMADNTVWDYTEFLNDWSHIFLL